MIIHRWNLGLLSLVFVGSLLGQDAPPPPPPPGAAAHHMPEPKNLKILKPEELMPAMRLFRTSLGVKCEFCHVQGNFASDDNPHKNIARGMITMTHEINGKFPDGKIHVTCYTCHRGSEEPVALPPAEAEKH